jgi:hypothetical protein
MSCYCNLLNNKRCQVCKDGIKDKSKDGIKEAMDKKFEMSGEIKERIVEKTSLPGEWKEIKLECPVCKEEGKPNPDEFVYLYDDQKTCYCCQCDKEFDVMSMQEIEDLREYFNEDFNEDLEDRVSDNPSEVSEMADKLLKKTECKCGGKNGAHFIACEHSPSIPTGPVGERKPIDKSGYSETECPHGWHYLKNCESCRKLLPNAEGQEFVSKGYTSFINNCTHRPQHIIAGEEWGVWAGKKTDCQPFAKDFDVVLNLTFTSIKEPHVIPIPELQEFEDYNCPYTEIQLDWPDYGVVNLPKEFWIKLLKHLEDNKLRMLVLCLGGHGRTGTALAVMMTMALDYTPDQAINWIRRHYCDHAIETKGQADYVSLMAKEPKPLKVDDKELQNKLVKELKELNIKSEAEIEEKR